MISSLSRLVSCAALPYRQAIHTLARLSVLLLALPSAPLHAADIVDNYYSITSDYELASPDTITLSNDLNVRGRMPNRTLFLQTGGVLDIASSFNLGQGSSSNYGAADYTINGGIFNAGNFNTITYRSVRSQVTFNGGSVNLGRLSDNNGIDVTVNGGSISIGDYYTNSSYNNNLSINGGTTFISSYEARNSASVLEISAGNNTINDLRGRTITVDGGQTTIDTFQAVSLSVNAGDLFIGSGSSANSYINSNLLITDGVFNPGNLEQSGGSVIYGVIKSGSSSYSVQGDINIVGSLSLQGGELVEGTSVFVDGDFDAGSTYAMRLSDFQTFGESDLTEVTLVEVNGGNFENNGQVYVAGGTINGDGLILNNGNIIGGGTFSNTNMLLNNGVITQQGDNVVFASTAGTMNYGAVNLETGRQMRVNSSMFTNSGTLDLNSSLVLGSGTLANGFGGSIVGAGTIATSFVNNGSIVVDSGTLNIVNDFTSNGVVQLAGLTANLNGGALTNAGNIQGFGNVASNISNQGTIESNNGTLVLNGTASNTSSGLISTEAGSQVLVLQGLASNEGIISLTGGTFDNNNKVLNNEGQISGHGTLRTGGLTNTDAVHFTGGATTINGNVTNEVGASMQVSYDAAIFTGDVVNNGIFKTTDTNVTFAGSYTENGIYISDPSDNYFQDLLIGENGSLVGGVGDNWHVSGDLINASTQASSWNTNDASLFMSGAGNQLLELSAEDLGASLLGYDDNFAWGELHVGSGIDLTLADGNAEEGGALYVGLFNYGGPVDFSAFVMAAIFSDYNIYYDADLAGNSYLMGNTFALNGSGSLIGISSVPVPAAAWLFGSALAGLLVARRKNKK